MPHHIVTVSNIPLPVYEGDDAEIAYNAYKDSVAASGCMQGKMSGEDVVWFKDGSVFEEYVGVLTEHGITKKDVLDWQIKDINRRFFS